MGLIDISDIKNLCSQRRIVWTEHVSERLRERNIKRTDVLQAITSGEIIEQYSDDTPFPSCLVLGLSNAARPLHVVCGVSAGEMCCVITAYYPAPDKWEGDYKTRKAAQ